jgi:hypothetical protein
LFFWLRFSSAYVDDIHTVLLEGRKEDVVDDIEGVYMGGEEGVWGLRV